jgi:hypothetical protein
MSSKPGGFLSLALLVALGSAACASRPERQVPEMARLLPYIEDGRTSKEQILLKLGEPSGHFEGERILTYRMIEGAAGEAVAAPPQGLGGWEGACFSLVLVFDERQILKTHNLLRVR